MAFFWEEELLVPNVSLYTGANALLEHTPWAIRAMPGRILINSINRYVYLFFFMDIGCHNKNTFAENAFIDIGYLKLSVNYACNTRFAKLRVNNRSKRLINRNFL